VSVEAAAPIVDVRSAGISDVVENERILELPLQGRQVTNLIVLAGAAVQTGTSSSRAMRGGVNISVAGGLPFGVAYLLDGAMHNNPQDNSNLQGDRRRRVAAALARHPDARAPRRGVQRAEYVQLGRSGDEPQLGSLWPHPVDDDGVDRRHGRPG